MSTTHPAPRLTPILYRHLAVVLISLLLMASLSLTVENFIGISTANAMGGGGGGGGGGGDGGSGGGDGGGSGGNDGVDSGSHGGGSGGSSGNDDGSGGQSAGTGEDGRGQGDAQAGRGLGNGNVGGPATGDMPRPSRSGRLGKAMSRVDEAATIARNWGGGTGSE